MKAEMEAKMKAEKERFERIDTSFFYRILYNDIVSGFVQQCAGIGRSQGRDIQNHM